MTLENFGRGWLRILVAALLCAATTMSGAATYQSASGGVVGAMSQSSYQGMYAPGDASAASMGGDALFVRPASLAATVAGTGLFILSLPISILGNNVEEAGHKLVVEPARYTFKRPLGHFRNDSNPGLP